MITLDGILVPLVLDSAKYIQGMEAASKKSVSFNSIIGVAGPAALGALTAFFVGATVSTFNWAETLDGLQDIIGGTTGEAAGLAVLFQHVGMTGDDLTSAMKKMSMGLTTASGDLGVSGLALESLGISAFDANGKMLPAVDIFQAVADKLAVMPDGLEKTQLMMDIFGKSGAEMGDALGAAAAGGLAAANVEAEKMNLNFSQEKTDSIIKSQQGINDLKTAFSGLGTELVTAALPAMDKVILALRWVIENKPILYGVIVTLGAITVTWLASIAVAGWAAIAPFLPLIAIIAAFIAAIGGIIFVVKNSIASFETFVAWIDKLAGKLFGLKLPSWLTPGSPTPLEYGLLGINKAFKKVASASLPEFNAKLNLGSGNVAQTKQSSSSEVLEQLKLVIENNKIDENKLARSIRDAILVAIV